MSRPRSCAPRRGSLAVLLLLTLCLGAATGRPHVAATGRIIGFVRDSAGVPIRYAQVLVIGTKFVATVDSLGQYVLSTVPAGSYRLRVRALGYRSAERGGVAVRDGATTRMNFVLQLAESRLDELVAAPKAQQEQERQRQAQQQAQSASPMVSASRIASDVASVGGPDWNTENYAVIEESRFLPAASAPRSTFSIDVDAGSYTNVRRFLTQGQRPPKDAVRI